MRLSPRSRLRCRERSRPRLAPAADVCKLSTQGYSVRMQLLAHHTSEAGLLGIVRGQSFWATQFFALKDQTEYFYALTCIYEQVVDVMQRELPKRSIDVLREKMDRTTFIDNIVMQIRNRFENVGYDIHYIVSFSKCTSESEKLFGIHCLWRNYAKESGYCLIFDRDDIDHMLILERMKKTYALLDIVDVVYGVDSNDRNFLDLCYQTWLRIQAGLAEILPDIEIDRESANKWSDAEYALRMIRYCSSHKDPQFAEEQEVRIVAQPLDVNTAQPFTGICTPKEVKERSIGGKKRKYIVLGDTFVPGVVPKRILASKKAALGPHILRGLYPLCPALEWCPFDAA